MLSRLFATCAASLTAHNGGKPTRMWLRDALIPVLAAVLVTGCLNQGASSSKGGSSSSKSSGFTAGGSTGSTSDSLEAQCLIFQNNSNDYATCISCKQTLCSCSSTTCDLSACTVSETLLVACVHENVAQSGGTCIGLKCGDGQIADFTSCTCKDAVPPSSIGPAPGHEDTLTPYLEPGFFVSSRFCPAADVTSGSPAALYDCLTTDGGSNGTTYDGTIPRHINQAPVNVHTDVGYIRWDLALDASQYPPFRPLKNKLPFLGTYSTILGSPSIFFQLKPNTVLKNASTIDWIDCVEHFSGFEVASGAQFVSTPNACDSRDVNGAHGATVDADANPDVKPVEYKTTATFDNKPVAGTAIVNYISMNGPAANTNITTEGTNANPVAKVTTSAADEKTLFGLGKIGNFDADALDRGTGNDGFAANEWQPADQQTGTGLFANIGTYKFTWGPVTVRRPGSVDDLSSGTVTTRVHLNVNLGYSPASIVESTALSSDASDGTVPFRDCKSTYNETVGDPTTPIIQNPCVTTAVYRAPGGAIMAQNYSSFLTSTNHASAISGLPAGVTAVSSPKLIEDTSQLAVADTSSTGFSPPARLRVFVRADDGNVYVNRTDRGAWQNWLSLGRPWLCSDQAGCSAGAFATMAPIYHPYKPTTAGTPPPSPFVSNAGGNTQNWINNGISIAGEPTVVKYMDETGGTGNPTIGYVAVLVRVSHYLSTADQANQILGPYHNAVFYTIGRTKSAAPTTTTTALELDTPAYWTPWMPIFDSDTGGETGLMKIQGNPTAIMQKVAGVVRLYAFGIQSGTATVARALHPPIAPIPNVNVYGAGQDIPSIEWGYYNYGKTITRAYLELTDGELGVTPYAAYNNTPPDWEGFFHDGSGVPERVAVQRAVVSDLVVVPVHSGAGTIDDFTSVRVLAMTLSQHTQPTDSANNPVNTISPAEYDREMAYFEYSMTPAAWSAGVSCTGTYDALKFVGTPSAVNLYDVSSADQGNPANITAGGHVADANNRLFIFGRAMCPENPKGRCDEVNPMLAYGVVESTTECDDVTRHDHMYYPGVTIVDNLGPPPDVGTNSPAVQGVYTSSDVVVTHSKAMETNFTSDVPVYFIFRNAGGRISHGFWKGRGGGASGTPTSGTPIFVPFNSGGMTR